MLQRNQIVAFREKLKDSIRLLKTNAHSVVHLEKTIQSIHRHEGKVDRPREMKVGYSEDTDELIAIHFK